MSKRKTEKKSQGSVFTASGATEHLMNWELIRARRNMWGTRQESEAVLDQLTGKLTDFELLTKLLNAKEEQAIEAIENWRRLLLCADLVEQWGTPSRDPSAELIDLYESFRAIQKTGDPQLVRIWISEQPFAVRFLIVNLFCNLPKPKDA